MQEKQKIKKIIYIIPPLIVLLIMAIVYLYKGFYPFGNKVLLQIDADYNYVPTYFKIYDIFHNHDSILWDFKLGGGANIYGSLVMNSVYGPVNWLAIFCNRNNICNFYNILIVIKFMLMSITMLIFIRKTFKTINSYWQIVFSIIYVFSGWGFLMFSNIFYIDTVILFPIVIMYLIKLLKEQKPLGLIITLSYSLILNFYLSYMIYLFIIFASFLYLIIFIDKEHRKKTIIQLSFTLLISLGISAFSSLPAVAQILSSTRGTETATVNYFYYLFLKIAYLCMSSIIVLLSSKYIIDYKEHKKESLFYGLLLFLMTIGVIIEPINMAWHTGSYNALPYRYSFMTIFTMICASIKYLETKKQMITVSDKNVLLVIIFIIICITLFIINFNKIILQELIGYDITKPGIIIVIMIICAFLIICHHLCYKLKNTKKFIILTTILLFFEVFIYANWNFNTYPGYDATKRSVYVKRNIENYEDNLYKYNDYQGNTIGINGSYVLRKATIANWLHIIPQKQLDFVNSFGYSYISELIYSFGGTIFSDTLIGVTDSYSLEQLPNDFFELDQMTIYDDTDVYYYKLKNDIPFGTILKNKIENAPSDMGFFETQNYYYKNIFDRKDDILNIKDYHIETENIKDNMYHLKISNKESKILYLEVNEQILKSNIEKIIIDDVEYRIGNTEKIVYLDYFSDAIEIDLKFKDDNDNQLENIKFAYITLNDYNKFVKLLNADYNKFDFNKNHLHINIDSNEEQYLFLPINNIDGWDIKINGKETKIEDALDIFMQIKLEQGNNDIYMTFTPPYLKQGIIASIISIVIVLITSIFKNKLYSITWLQKIITFFYYFVTITLFILIYILSNFIL